MTTDKERINNALEMVEMMIIEVENMHNVRLKAMGQITKAVGKIYHLSKGIFMSLD